MKVADRVREVFRKPRGRLPPFCLSLLSQNTGESAGAAAMRGLDALPSSSPCSRPYAPIVPGASRPFQGSEDFEHEFIRGWEDRHNPVLAAWHTVVRVSQLRKSEGSVEGSILVQHKSNAYARLVCQSHEPRTARFLTGSLVSNWRRSAASHRVVRTTGRHLLRHRSRSTGRRSRSRFGWASPQDDGSAR